MHVHLCPHLSGEWDMLVPLKHFYPRHVIILKTACAENDSKFPFSLARVSEDFESSWCCIL